MPKAKPSHSFSPALLALARDRARLYRELATVLPDVGGRSSAKERQALRAARRKDRERVRSALYQNMEAIVRQVMAEARAAAPATFIDEERPPDV